MWEATKREGRWGQDQAWQAIDRYRLGEGGGQIDDWIIKVRLSYFHMKKSFQLDIYSIVYEFKGVKEWMQDISLNYIHQLYALKMA